MYGLGGKMSKRRIKLWIRCAFAVAAAISSVQVAVAQTDTLETIKSRGKLIAGVRADLPPWGTLAKDGTFVGFDAEVFQYFAKKLGVGLELRQATSQTMIPLLQTGAIDIGPSSAPSVTREQSVDFSDVAAWETTKVMVLKSRHFGSMPKQTELYPIKSFALVHGTYWGTLVQKKYPNAEFIYFQEYPMAVLAVKSGKADATVLGLAGSAKILQENSDLELLPEAVALDPTAFPVRENDSKWRKWVNHTLQEMWKDGSLQTAYKKHWGADPFFHPWSPYMLQPGMDEK
jgi:polar amino acid transport system substrate-binding protein